MTYCDNYNHDRYYSNTFINSTGTIVNALWGAKLIIPVRLRLPVSVFAKSVILVRLPFFVSLVGVIIRVRFTDTHSLSQPYQYSNPFLNDAGTTVHVGKLGGWHGESYWYDKQARNKENIPNHTGTICHCAFFASICSGCSKKCLCFAGELLKSAVWAVNHTGTLALPSTLIRGGMFNKSFRVCI